MIYFQYRQKINSDDNTFDMSKYTYCYTDKNNDKVYLDQNKMFFLVIDSKTNKPKNETTSEIDYSKDFFNNAVYLTVSNQLHLECMAHGMGNVYTITPATRVNQHKLLNILAHFNMLEYEFCFNTWMKILIYQNNLIKYCASNVLLLVKMK